jgi:hypothetical protein
MMSTDQARAEALQESKTITFRDLKLTIPPPDEWLLDYFHWSERDQITRAVESMLGTAQYAEFVATTPPPKMSDVEGLMNQTLSSLGIDAGELRASTG